MHPCERAIFEKIIDILSSLSEIVRFAKFFGGVSQRDTSDFTDAHGKESAFFIYGLI